MTAPPQRLASWLACAAILLLAAILVFVWTHVGHSTGRSQTNHNSDLLTKTNQIDNLIEPKSDTGKQLLNASLLDNMETEYVKPLKLSPPPLHQHDIIYDQLRNQTTTQHGEYHSGHFRQQMAEVWDPHPQYEIRAFGRVFILELAQYDKFISPNLHVFHVRENYTEWMGHDVRTSRCFYKGRIRGVEESRVTVSLCNGMKGYIDLPFESFYIEPVERFANVINNSILHRIVKVRQESNDVTDEDLCGITEAPTVVDVPIDPEDVHAIHKRDLLVDGLESDEFDQTFVNESLLDLYANHELKGKARKKRTGQEYHIEVMVVADKDMVEYHKNEEELKHYILTLMSQVDSHFKEPSIGNPISLAVVKILVLSHKQFKGETSAGMLKEFCDWQRQYHNIHPHDIAILLTRSPFCKNKELESNCNYLGVANVGSMCSENTSCSIVMDKGLFTSYTIAHEMGHVLSMPHDGDDKCTEHHEGRQVKNIMSNVFQKDTQLRLWSQCSRHYLTEFLESGNAECLLDTPYHDQITDKFVDVLPGETFKVDRQCELEFGKGYKFCSQMHKHRSDYSSCESLYCTTDTRTGCKSQDMPWADGTSCGYNSWCHRGECVALNRLNLQPISGGWSDWKGWGACSRSCGGGIQFSERDCNNPIPSNRGSYCVGSRKRYRSCNIGDCPSDSLDFRAVQCREFDGNSANIPGLPKNVKWDPKYLSDHPNDQCKLYCRVRNSSEYYPLREKVVDGTKCGLKSFDMCVNGICKRAGCDNILDSSIVLDACGVCGGDNSTCEEISGSYNISTNYGYHPVVRLPKGAFHILIQQRDYSHSSRDQSFLALVDGETGAYILNGNYVVAQSLKEVIFDQVVITYSGADTNVENITTPRYDKLNKEMMLTVLTTGNQIPPGITYKYLISHEHSPKYSWQLYDRQWTKCNSICDGTQSLRPVCVELATSTRVHESHCSNLDVAVSRQQRGCNAHCRLAWNVAYRSQCSAQCGEGRRSVQYHCVKIDVVKQTTKSNQQVVVDEKHCSNIPKPAEVEACQGECGATQWKYTDWSQCTKTCGGGVQIRTAHCVDNNDQTLPDSQCKPEKITKQLCNLEKCPVWSFDDWTPCSVTCGKGFRTKPFFCTINGRSISPEFCNRSELPPVREECEERPCVQWAAGPWEDCNVPCGTGLQTRDVVCRTIHPEGIIVEDHLCKEMLKPNSSKVCVTDECVSVIALPIKRTTPFFDEDNHITSLPKRVYRWRTGAWNKCSKPCGGGSMSRMVACRNDANEENHYACDGEKPVSIVQCNTSPCPKWNYGAWSTCDNQCQKYRQVSCQSHKGDLLDDDQCLEAKPTDMVKCNDRCHPWTRNDSKDRRYKWKVGRWGPCSKSCGKGTRTRHVSCTMKDVTVVDQYCNHLKKPKTSRVCEKTNCDYVWVEEAWSPCSISCGQGIKERNVSCHRVLSGGYIDPTIVDFIKGRGYCDLYNKPQSETSCIESNCEDLYRWKAGTWGACSQPCGKKGRQVRPLYCVSRDGKKVRNKYCPRNLKPNKKQKCNQRRCLHRTCKEVKHNLRTSRNDDYRLLIKGKEAIVYCYKMDTRHPLEYISLQGGRTNYAEQYDKTLLNIETCPHNGERRTCYSCRDVSSERSGFTYFWKVRLNITSLRIIRDDFTFSNQTKGSKVQYGSAGDCYSAHKGCAQGQFSVDLTETSFRLAEHTRWRYNGHNASMQLDVREKTAVGRCGGYCGQCFPDPATGLAVEVT